MPLAGPRPRDRGIDVAPPGTPARPGSPRREAGRTAGVGSPTRVCRDGPTRSGGRRNRRRRVPRCRRGKQSKSKPHPQPTQRNCAHASQPQSQRANPSPRNLHASSRATIDAPLESARARMRAHESKTATAIAHLSMGAENFRHVARISCVVRALENFLIETIDSLHRKNQFFPMAMRAQSWRPFERTLGPTQPGASA